MHYVITGSLGNTGKPITEGLLNAGHTVTVVTINVENKARIEALGAKAAVGDVADAAFVVEAFANADAVYLMIPPKWGATDWRGYQNGVSDNYVAAIQANDIRFVVMLSSIGAHLPQGVGPVNGLYDLEQKLKTIDPASRHGFQRVLARPALPRARKVQATKRWFAARAASDRWLFFRSRSSIWSNARMPGSPSKKSSPATPVPLR